MDELARPGSGVPTKRKAAAEHPPNLSDIASPLPTLPGTGSLRRLVHAWRGVEGAGCNLGGASSTPLENPATLAATALQEEEGQEGQQQQQQEEEKGGERRTPHGFARLAIVTRSNGVYSDLVSAFPCFCSFTSDRPSHYPPHSIPPSNTAIASSPAAGKCHMGEKRNIGNKRAVEEVSGDAVLVVGSLADVTSVAPLVLFPLRPHAMISLCFFLFSSNHSFHPLQVLAAGHPMHTTGAEGSRKRRTGHRFDGEGAREGGG